MNEPQRSRAGCLPYGLAIAFAIVVILTVGVGYYVIWRHQASVEYYTVAEFTPVTSAAPSAQVLAQVEGKLDSLLAAYSSRLPLQLSLSAEEVSAIPFAKQVSPDLRDKLSIGISGQELVVNFSVRLRDLSLGFAEVINGERLDRFASGSFQGAITTEGERYKIKLSSMTLGGRKLEDMALSGAEAWIEGAINALVAQDPLVGDRRGSLSVKDGRALLSLE